MPNNDTARRRNSALVVASTFLALAGLALGGLGLLGGLEPAAAGDPPPLPQPDTTPILQTVIPTEVSTSVPTEVPTEVSTSVPTEVPTSVPTTVPTSVPTSVPATSTSQPLTVATAVPTTLVQTVAGVTALPATGEGASGTGVSWLLVAVGAAVCLAGLAGIAAGRRRA
jgi:hypothetical protein